MPSPENKKSIPSPDILPFGEVKINLDPIWTILKGITEVDYAWVSAEVVFDEISFPEIKHYQAVVDVNKDNIGTLGFGVKIQKDIPFSKKELLILLFDYAQKYGATTIQGNSRTLLTPPNIPITFLIGFVEETDFFYVHPWEKANIDGQPVSTPISEIFLKNFSTGIEWIIQILYLILGCTPVGRYEITPSVLDATFFDSTFKIIGSLSDSDLTELGLSLYFDSKVLQDRGEEVKHIQSVNSNETEQKIIHQDSFSEIAGQDGAVEIAKELVLAITHPETYEKRGVMPPKGIIFFGQPGTGKTLLARIIAEEANAEFIEVNGADFRSPYYGETDRAIQQLFDRANALAKTGKKVIIYFDEVDEIAAKRSDHTPIDTRILSLLLQNIDGFRSNSNVTILASTNRIESIDPAFLRSGRIDRRVFFDLPDLRGRIKIIQVHMKKAENISTSNKDLFEEIDLDALGEITSGMNGADLANMVNRALEKKVLKEIQGSEWSPVNTNDLIESALEFLQPIAIPFSVFFGKRE